MIKLLFNNENHFLIIVIIQFCFLSTKINYVNSKSISTIKPGVGGQYFINGSTSNSDNLNDDDYDESDKTNELKLELDMIKLNSKKFAKLTTSTNKNSKLSNNTSSSVQASKFFLNIVIVLKYLK